MRTPQRPTVSSLDVVVALALTLALQGEIWAPQLFGADEELVQRPALAVLGLAITLPLAFRRRAPWLVSMTAFAAEIAMEQLATPPDGLGNLLAMLVVAYSLGRHAAPPWRRAGIAVVTVTAFSVGEDLADHTFVLVVLGAAWVAGVIAAFRSEQIDDLEVRRLEAAQEGAQDERLRIARELHDVVAHRVSMIVVQSQLADTLLDTDPGRARGAVRAVEDAGRQALTELRSVLDLLHAGDPAARAPGDTDLGRLADLVTDVRGSGLPVTFCVEGAPRPVPPAVALAAFRIVQESLTNVVRHADSASTSLVLAYGDGAVTVDVQDSGTSVPSNEPTGHGLAGMQERAAFVGGRLEAGPSTTGGFRVHAVLPVPGEVR